MLKATAIGFDEPLLADLTRYIDLLPDTLEDEALDLAVQFESNLALIYNTAPPRGDTKFVWSLDKQKNLKALRWWFWAVKQGIVQTDGRHYIRQGKPPYGGEIRVERDSERITIVVTNRWRKAGLVFGQIGKDTRLPGHKETGWEYADPKIKELRKLYLEALFNRVLERRVSEGRL